MAAGRRLQGETGLPGEVSHGLIERRILIAQVHAFWFEDLSSFQALFDALSEIFRAPAHLRIRMMTSLLQGRQRRGAGGIEFAGRVLSFVELFAPQLIDEAGNALGVSWPV